jgi:hypothetical protein
MSAISTILLTLFFLATAVPTSALPLQARQNDDLAPEQSATAWNAGAVTEFQIHASCNASEARQLRAALAETVDLAKHAKQHVLRYANSSEQYRKYFGDAPSGEVVGYLDKIVSGDRGSSLFRCDNPDGNCELEGRLTGALSLHLLTWKQDTEGTGVGRTPPTRPSSVRCHLRLEGR